MCVCAPSEDSKRCAKRRKHNVRKNSNVPKRERLKEHMSSRAVIHKKVQHAHEIEIHEKTRNSMVGGHSLKMPRVSEIHAHSLAVLNQNLPEKEMIPAQALTKNKIWCTRRAVVWYRAYECGCVVSTQCNSNERDYIVAWIVRYAVCVSSTLRDNSNRLWCAVVRVKQHSHMNERMSAPRNTQPVKVARNVCMCVESMRNVGLPSA